MSWQPEIFYTIETWDELFTAIDEVFDTHITQPTIELEELRNITSDTDPFVVSQMLKQLGFDIPADLIRGNQDRLAKAIYMLPLYHETSGTDNFIPPLEFILGRHIDMRRLYTDDYKHFHETPLGATIKDGGEWYLTTHIDLTMEVLHTDDQLVLAEQETIKSRLIDAFYEFAPIELVINEFRNLIVIYAELGIKGVVEIWPQRRIKAGDGNCEPIGIRIIGPSVVNSFEAHQYKVEVYFSDLEPDDNSPVFGKSSAGVDTDVEVTAYLDTQFPDWEDQVFAIDLGPGEYGYFALPASLGQVQFIDTSNDLQGGWDGARWPLDGSIGTELGPAVIQRDINGTISDWYVYRTDFPGIGKKAFRVEQKETDIPVDDVEYVKLYPRAGLGPYGLSTDMDIAMLDPIDPDTPTSHVLELYNDETSKFMYFAIPKTAGTASFINVENNLEGGWDGAAWAENDIGDTLGPIEVQRVIQGTDSLWDLYRADFPATGGKFLVQWGQEIPDLAINIDNPTIESLAASVTEQFDILPRYFAGPEGITGAADLPTDYTELNESNPLLFSYELGDNEYGYLMIPATTSDHMFLETNSNLQGGWDGASWPAGQIGSTYGPLEITAPYMGKDVVWYLFRTDFPGSAFDFSLSYNGYLGTVSVTTEVEDPIIPIDSASPIFFKGPYGVDTEDEILRIPDRQYIGPGDNPFLLQYDLGPDEYGYLLIPKRVGDVTFLDLRAQLEGGWDGASWPQNDVGGTGPIEINMNVDGETEWYLFRTDFFNIQDNMFEVSYENPLTDTGPVLPPDPILPDEPVIDTPPGKCRSRIEIADAWTSQNSIIGFGKNGYAEVTDAHIETNVPISVSYMGFTNSKTVTVVPLNRGELEDIYLVGPDEINAGESVYFTAVGHFSRGADQPVYPEWSRTNPLITVSSAGLVTAGEVAEDTEVYVTVRMDNQNGVEIIGAKKILVRAVPEGVQVASIRIDAPSEILENSADTAKLFATFNDSTELEVMPRWTIHTEAAVIDNSGTINVMAIEDDVSVQLTASYTHRGKTLETSVPIMLRKDRYLIVALDIIGPNGIMENSTTQFTCLATWNNKRPDGTNMQSYVTAEWSSNKFEMTEYGALIAGSVDSPREVLVTAKARKTQGGSIATTKSVLINNKQLAVEYLTIIGPESIKEDIVSKYNAYATFNDGTTKKVTPDWSTAGNTPFITVDENGQALFDNDHNVNSVGIVEIEAAYKFGNKVVNDSLPVVLVPKVDVMIDLEVRLLVELEDGSFIQHSDPEAVVEEGRRIHLVAIAIYSDDGGQTTKEVEVSPVWTALNTDPLNMLEPPVRVVRSAGIGVIEGRSVDEDTAVWIEARYFSKKDRYKVVVTNFVPGPVDPVLESWIDGPTIVRGGEIGSFAQYCVFGMGVDLIPTTPIAVSSDWELDVDSSVATIDQDGYMNVYTKEPVRATVTATFVCSSSETTVDHFIIDILPEENDFAAMRILGPDMVTEESTTPFTAELTRKDGSVHLVNATWEIEPTTVGVQALPPGLVHVTTLVEEATVTLKAVYAENTNTIEATKQLALSRIKPTFGSGPIGIDSWEEIEQLTGSGLPSFEDQQEFELVVPSGEYGYFLVPVTAGLVTFYDTDADMVGGWDGASWPTDGSIGEGRGPIQITRTVNDASQDWYLYRTDFPGIGARTWRVTIGA